MINRLDPNTTASFPNTETITRLSLSLTTANRLREQSLLKMKPVANLQWTKAAPGCLTNLSVMSAGVAFLRVDYADVDEIFGSLKAPVALL